MKVVWFLRGIYIEELYQVCLIWISCLLCLIIHLCFLDCIHWYIFGVHGPLWNRLSLSLHEGQRSDEECWREEKSGTNNKINKNIAVSHLHNYIYHLQHYTVTHTHTHTHTHTIIRTHTSAQGQLNFTVALKPNHQHNIPDDKNRIQLISVNWENNQTNNILNFLTIPLTQK